MPVATGDIAVLDQLDDIHWRLNNIYWCVDDDGKRVQFRMRPPQKKLLTECWWRNIIVKARQLGFTTFISILGLDFALFNDDKTVGFIAHDRASSTNIYQKKILFPFDNLPEIIQKAKFDPRANQRQDAGGLISFRNGSNIRVGTSFRSDTCQFLHVSEFAKICARYPARAKEVITGSLPTVHRTGRVFFESTTEGAFGYFFDMAQKANNKLLSKSDLTYLDYRLHFFPWHEDPKYEYTPDEAKKVLITPKQHEYFDGLEHKLGKNLNLGRRAWYVANKETLSDLMFQEMPSTFEEAFQTIIEGAYYKAQLDKARASGRIGKFYAIKGVPVHTSWDLGINDCQAIWFWQEYGGMFRFVNYYQADGEGLAHYCEVIKEFLDENECPMGENWGPHDIQNREWTSAQSRIDIAYTDYGIKFYQAPNIGRSDGIDAVRRVFKKCQFNEETCSHGLKALEAYQKEWDEKRACYRQQPLHNWASDGADAFRMFAVSNGNKADTGNNDDEQVNDENKSLEDLASIWQDVGV